MKKILLSLLLFLVNFSFAQNFLKIGYGSNGYRLGLDLQTDSYLFSYISLIAENKYEDGNSTINSENYSYTLNALYFNLGLMLKTKIKNLYINPFAKLRRAYFKIENSTYEGTKSTWKVGGGLNLAYYACIIPGFILIPQAYIYYMPKETFYFKNKKITEIGKNAFQVGLALDLNIGFGN